MRYLIIAILALVLSGCEAYQLGTVAFQGVTALIDVARDAAADGGGSNGQEKN